MRELFILDKKNYNPNGTVGKRPSVRAIILKDNKIAMMYSQKYKHYKLPGGGIENNETYEETLVREVREESGLVVKKDTIKEFGYVRKIEKGSVDDIFIQDNYYFICEVEDDKVDTQLDDYEKEEGFTLEFVDIDYAIEVNENATKFENEDNINFKGMLERENKVLKLIKEELL